MTAVNAATRRPEVVDFLLTRRSRPAKTLVAPGPSRADIETILTAAARSPDHGKLEPWRFAVAEGAALGRLAGLAEARARALFLDEAAVAKARKPFDDAVCVLVVIASPKPSEKIPAGEQAMSAGAVCLAAVNAALALGYGANWLTGWVATDAAFCAEALGCAEGETVAGFIHVGTESVAPTDRPRPDVGALTTWL
jgi:nitroreductase